MMEATPVHLGLSGKSAAPRAAGRTPFGQAAPSPLSMKWAALHDAAAAVAALAGIAPAPMSAELRAFPAAIREGARWRRDLAEQGIEDLSAIMEPGLSALLSVHARGADAGPAALALWREFCTARDALLVLLPAFGAARPA